MLRFSMLFLSISVLFLACTRKSKEEERLFQIMNESFLVKERYDIEELARVRALVPTPADHCFFDFSRYKFVPICYLFTPAKDMGVCIYASRILSFNDGRPEVVYRYYWLAFKNKNQEWLLTFWPNEEIENKYISGYKGFVLRTDLKSDTPILTAEEIARLLLLPNPYWGNLFSRTPKEFLSGEYWFDSIN